jgi:hypothetical protein
VGQGGDSGGTSVMTKEIQDRLPTFGDAESADSLGWFLIRRSAPL